MTADHPTREERYAAAIEAHPPGDYTHLFDADPASTPFERTVRCRCGWRGPSSHAAHVAAALVAADPAPAQPEDPCICPPDLCLGAEHQDGPGTVECCACLALDPELPCLHDPASAQPDATLSDEERMSLWADALAARAAQPVPAPEVWGDVLRVARTAVDSAYGTDPRHDLLARAVADAVAYGKPLPWSLSKHFGRDTPAPEVHLPGCQQFPTGWLCVAACTTVWKDNPAPEVSRGVAEHLAGIFRSIAEEKLDGALDRMTWRAAMLAAAAIVEEDARRRDPHPADDGADCCRERTTAGGCGCGGDLLARLDVAEAKVARVRELLDAEAICETHRTESVEGCEECAIVAQIRIYDEALGSALSEDES